MRKVKMFELRITMDPQSAIIHIFDTKKEDSKCTLLNKKHCKAIRTRTDAILILDEKETRQYCADLQKEPIDYSSIDYNLPSNLAYNFCANCVRKLYYIPPGDKNK